MVQKLGSSAFQQATAFSVASRQEVRDSQINRKDSGGSVWQIVRAARDFFFLPALGITDVLAGATGLPEQVPPKSITPVIPGFSEDWMLSGTQQNLTGNDFKFFNKNGFQYDQPEQSSNP